MKAASPINNLAVMNKLAQANNVIDKFINSCSHSMRGPLKTIRGLVNLLSEESSKNSKPEPMLDLIQRTAGHLENILNQLEQFLENSKKDMKVEEVNIHSVISEVEEKFQREITEQSIEVQVHVEPEEEIVVTDRGHLKTILTQLLSNAIYFADPTKEKKRVLITGRATSTSYEITVADNGVGIPEECRGKIFMLFYRGSEKSKGAGIGLYIVKEVVERMKGIVSVESQVKSGTKFLVWLPNLN